MLNLGGRHRFVRDTNGLALRSRPAAPAPEPLLENRTWLADPEKIALSGPGYYPPDSRIHRALAALDVGSPLTLCQRSDGTPGWELTDPDGVPVGRMSSKFQPPNGEIVAVRVAAVLVRSAREGEQGLRSARWEPVLPEIEYLPAGR